MLPQATDGVDPKLIEHEEDILSYVLLPEPAVEYFKWRALPPEQRPETPADLELKKLKPEAKPDAAQTQSAALQSQHAEQVSQLALTLQSLVGAAPGLVQELLQKIDGLAMEEVVFRRGDQRIVLCSAEGAGSRGGASISAPQTVAATQPTAALPATPLPVEQAAPAAEYKRTINAPLVGKFYSTPGPGKPSFVKDGDTVEAGAKVCIVEAMKLFNEITAPVKCRIVKMLAEDGKAVQKGEPLVAIEEI
jgi:acetyl-CoA carboxylase biotin carboxyl carrier protein